MTPDCRAALEPRGAERDARQLLIHAVCQYCRGEESLTTLGQRLGLSLSALTMARTRIEQRLDRDRPFYHTWSQVGQKLKDLSGV